ncbi:endonuclease [Desulfurococcus mucosus]|uniref:endonuclease n=1 Tax=Desulfurococcus mucosus TaxID=2275 RepID=UPI000AA6C1D8
MTGLNGESGLRILFDPSTCRASTSDPRAVGILEEKWFGRRSRGDLVLDLVEVAYLILEKKAVVETATGVVLSSLEELMREAYGCFKDFFWPQLLVYKDLRDRGRRVRVVDQGRFLVKDKSGGLRLVYVLEEKKLISIDSIVKEAENARDNSLQLVLAIVSLQGDITYYEAGEVALG